MSFIFTFYFARFPDFDHHPRRSIRDEFSRLAKTQEWSKKETARQRVVCYTEELERYFADLGMNHQLKRLQHLCVQLDVEFKDTITQCKKVLKNTYVNLVDLMNARRTGKKVKKFDSYNQLRKYTKATGETYTKKDAKDDVVKVLLRRVSA